ncbi:MAG: class I tRNA ligase family protein, partial [Candidatus Gribaldobacteria bacterium]|nr:class I tRNA ligase family protein [Candidatus Gribaldobacteria bacterium]
SQSPTNNMRFGYNVAKETERKILIFQNCFTFFKTYCQTPEIKGIKPKNILDKWILSRLNNLIKEATENLEGFNPSKASLAIENFWINDLSLWFVRRSRKRFQNPESSEDKEQAESTFYFVLLATCKLLAPFMPFLSEEIYQKLKTNAMPESIHLCEWPKADKKLIDENLEQEVVSTRNLVEEALSLRAELKIGVRQPVASITVPAFKITGISAGSAMIFKEEVNVKEIFVSEDLKELKIDTTMSDELKEEGLVREIVRQIQDLRKKAGLTPADRVDVCYIGSVEVEAILVKNEKQILETTKSQKLIKANSQMADYLATKETKIENGSLFLGIIKV